MHCNFVVYNVLLTTDCGKYYLVCVSHYVHAFFMCRFQFYTRAQYMLPEYRSCHTVITQRVGCIECTVARSLYLHLVCREVVGCDICWHIDSGMPPKFTKNYCRDPEYLHVIHLLVQIHSEYCCCVCCNSKYYTIFSKQSHLFLKCYVIFIVHFLWAYNNASCFLTAGQVCWSELLQLLTFHTTSYIVVIWDLYQLLLKFSSS